MRIGYLVAVTVALAGCGETRRVGQTQYAQPGLYDPSVIITNSGNVGKTLLTQDGGTTVAWGLVAIDSGTTGLLPASRISGTISPSSLGLSGTRGIWIDGGQIALPSGTAYHPLAYGPDAGAWQSAAGVAMGTIGSTVGMWTGTSTATPTAANVTLGTDGAYTYLASGAQPLYITTNSITVAHTDTTSYRLDMGYGLSTAAGGVISIGSITPSLGGATGVLSLADTTCPTTAITGGGVLCSAGSDLKWCFGSGSGSGSGATSTTCTKLAGP